MRLTRDSAFWWFSLAGSVAVTITAQMDKFSWMPDDLRHAIELASFIYGIVSAKMMTSPLPGKNEFHDRSTDEG